MTVGQKQPFGFGPATRTRASTLPGSRTAHADGLRVAPGDLLAGVLKVAVGADLDLDLEVAEQR